MYVNTLHKKVLECHENPVCILRILRASHVEVQHVLRASKNKLVKLNHNLIYQRFVFVVINSVNLSVAGAYPCGAYGILIKTIDNHRRPNERYTELRCGANAKRAPTTR